MLTVTRRFEFCYAHFLPGHEKCGTTHGHNGILEVTISGVQDEDGMIIDFSRLKEIVEIEVLTHVDHKNLNEEFNFVPTAELLCGWVAQKLKKYQHLIFQVERVRLYETSNCWAEWTR